MRVRRQIRGTRIRGRGGAPLSGSRHVRVRGKDGEEGRQQPRRHAAEATRSRSM
ncbi:hypothetical protein SFR_0455 [Streptomyces sp. FR-008]|nr:hypothetical protein SFR_0455 [Streptomyces sp. FR-008]